MVVGRYQLCFFWGCFDRACTPYVRLSNGARSFGDGIFGKSKEDLQRGGSRLKILIAYETTYRAGVVRRGITFFILYGV